MADAPTKKKGTKIPVGVLAGGGALVAYLLYKKFAGGSSSSDDATPATAAAGGPDYSDDSGESGGGGGGGSPTPPTATTPPTSVFPYPGTGTTGGAGVSPVLTPVNYGAGVSGVTTNPGVYIETTPTSSGATPGSVDIRK